jgi:hypothetical protein
MIDPLAILFALGIANFAIQRAVVTSGHEMLAQLPAGLLGNRGRPLLVFEFVVLVAAMLLSERGFGAAVWVYALYTGVNCFGAWLILSRRI